MEIKEALIKLIESTDGLHKRFGLSEIDGTQEELNNRLRIQMEEVGELAGAISYGDKDEILTEATDIAVVAIGTLLLLGNKAVSAAERVINKNDAKTDKTHRLEGGKIIRLNR